MSSHTVQAAPKPTTRKNSPARAWSRALELTAGIANHPDRVLSTVVEELAAVCPEAPALLSEGESLTYRTLAERSNRYARWALDQLARGEAVCLLMPNRPEYVAIWLGITSVGGVVGLLNTNLTGPSLAHSINAASPRHIIVSAELVQALGTALPSVSGSPTIWTHGTDQPGFPRIDRDIERRSGDALKATEGRSPTLDDRALYIYTSGTTGLPKAANVSHARMMQWSFWFAGMMDACADDRLYSCLPMYHSIGGVVATGAMLASGGSVVIRDRFSAREFWNDLVRWDCTLFQYIGELCRYLLLTEPHPLETAHRLRLCCGNGLSGDVWEAFKDRFRIPQILEFYAATEGNVSLFNVEEKPGAIGRIPPYLAHRFPAALVRLDMEAAQPIRSRQGFCVRCAPNEPGEALGRILEDRSNIGSRFDGYTSPDASKKKILRDVFETGDAWFRSGDLMRQDEKGYFYFVDRIGDTFRWKGENVSTTEVSAVIAQLPGVKQAIVYGVTIPGADGRAGMATIVADDRIDLAALRAHLIERLPEYARPLFVRMRSAIDLTATFKYTTADLVSQGYDPHTIPEIVYFNDPARAAFVPLDAQQYDLINTGRVRL